MTTLSTFTHFANGALLAETIRLAAEERLATGRLIAALAEVDARKLYLGEGCSSLFVYCTRVLHLSEHAAYSRIEAARAAQRFPRILELLIDGSLTLTTVMLLAPQLTEDNHRVALDAACHKSKREVELQVAALRPLPPVAGSIRKLPQRKCTGATADVAQECEAAWTAVPIMPAAIARPSDTRASVPVKPPVVKPLSPEHYKIQFTMSRDMHEKLRRAQDLLRHSIPDGDPAKIFDKALTLLLTSVEKKKLAATAKPRDNRSAQGRSPRHIPASVRRAVWSRDEGRCAFVGRNDRCDERGFLEFHHRQPFASGGATIADNLELRCRAHNAYEAELFFGPFLTREERATYAGEELGPDRVADLPHSRNSGWR